jgi:hypothetical protein
VRANEQRSAVLVDATVSAATSTWHGSYLSRKGAGLEGEPYASDARRD